MSFSFNTYSKVEEWDIKAVYLFKEHLTVCLCVTSAALAWDTAGNRHPAHTSVLVD